MKMLLKLAYCAFSLSPSKDATMSTFWAFSKDGRMGSSYWWLVVVTSGAPRARIARFSGAP